MTIEPVAMYESCSHGHFDEDEDDRAGHTGVIELDDGEWVCDEGIVFYCCPLCCVSIDGFQEPACEEGHSHGAGLPWCPTHDTAASSKAAAS